MFDNADLKLKAAENFNVVYKWALVYLYNFYSLMCKAIKNYYFKEQV